MCEGRAEAEFAILARNFIAFSKPKNLRPDREFESYLVRQLVAVFAEKFRHPKFLRKIRGLASRNSTQITTESEVWRLLTRP